MLALAAYYEDDEEGRKDGRSRNVSMPVEESLGQFSDEFEVECGVDAVEGKKDESRHKVRNREDGETNLDEALAGHAIVQTFGQVEKDVNLVVQKQHNLHSFIYSFIHSFMY